MNVFGHVETEGDFMNVPVFREKVHGVACLALSATTSSARYFTTRITHDSVESSTKLYGGRNGRYISKTHDHSLFGFDHGGTYR
jgi:hypothetical protein